MEKEKSIRWHVAGTAAAMLVAGVFVSASLAHDHGGHGHAPQPACEDTGLACASAATPAFSGDGSLWLVWAAGGYVSVAKSSDLGASFGPAKTVNREPLQIDWGPDARPKIAVDKAGRVFVTFTVFKDKAFNGKVFYSTSKDGDEKFSSPLPITSNEESQRFEALALTKDGKLFAAWLDKRNRVAAKEKGEKYPGAGLAFAWATADHTGVGETRIAHDNSCECCRIAVAFTGEDRPVIAFRNIFEGGIRDHAIVTFTDAAIPGPVRRVSTDDWQTDACPHQGPSLAISASNKYHVAWYTDGLARSGLFYASSPDGGEHFSDPLPLGNPDHNPSRPSLLAVGKTVWLAWKEFDGEETAIFAMVSRDEGGSWNKAKKITGTHGSSDHPLLIAGKGGAFLSWLTHDEGYRLLSLEAGS